MDKKVLGIFILMLIVISFVGFAKALDVPKDNVKGDKSVANVNNYFSFLDIWEKGTSLDQTAAKYLFLFLIMLFVLAVLSSADFPQSSVLRFFLSIVIGFLATFFITPDEIYALLASYSGLGLTISLFLPVFILVLSTVMLARRANSLGVSSSVFLWAIYGVYMIYKGSMIFLFKLMITNHESISVAADGNVAWGNAVISPLYAPLLTMLSSESLVQISKSSSIVGLMILVIGLLSIWLGVFNRRFWVGPLLESIRNDQIESFKDTQRRARAVEDERAEATRGNRRR